MTANLKAILASRLVHSASMNCFVQLMHPGAEPKISRAHPLLCPANTGKVHTRKFLWSSGEYLDINGQVQRGELNFWGEWELASKVQRLFHKRQLGMPLYVHFPDYPKSSSIPTIKNNSVKDVGLVTAKNKPCSSLINSCGHTSTDPFVFCNPFLYFHCQIKPNSRLDNLQRGDVVIFGSHLNGHFVLDTVFVVSERVPLNDLKVCSKFLWVNKPFFNQFPDQVYLGATFANPVNGMFSFFPALPVKNNTPQPFSRPVINLPNYINHNLMMHHKIKNTNNIESIWLDLVWQISNIGLSLGLNSC